MSSRLALSCLLATFAEAGPGLATEAPRHWLLAVADVAVSEESCEPHQAVFTVRLFKRVHNLPPRVVTVQYATADGSAVGGVDYTPVSGTLTFTPPNLVLTVAVPITDALVPGPDKSFTLNLSKPTGAIFGRPTGTATLHAPSVAKCASCALSCDDGEGCTADSCSPTVGCRNVDVNACATAACDLGACALDTDGDGLSDAWETNGYVDVDCNGQYDGPAIDVPLPGANPSSSDIYVRYDYMEKTGAGAHTHQPPQAALDQVEAAFAGRGVALHFAAPPGGIPERQVTTLDPAPSAACAGVDFVTMPELRAANLGSLGPAYHYMVFAHFSTCPDTAHCAACPIDAFCGGTPDPASSGSADLPGDDAIIASANIGSPGPIELEAGTTMHELGHNLGLMHGGDEPCVNQKPNYTSVMNYSYQAYGIVQGDAPGSTNLIPCATETDCGPPTQTSGPCATPNACHCSSANFCYRLDYSDLLLQPLDEASLDETTGVAGPAADRDIVLYFVPGSPTVELLGPSDGSPIDWNGSGTIESGVAVDLDNSGGPPEVLHGWDDWETSSGLFVHLDFAFQCAAGAGLAAEWTTNEMSRDYALQHRLTVGRRVTPRPKGE